MRSARSLGLIAAITPGSLLTTGLGAAASPRQTGLDIPAPPQTERNEAFTPPASAQGKPAGKAAAPKTAWEADFEVDAGEPIANRAPGGTPIGAPGLGALPYFGFDEICTSGSTAPATNSGCIKFEYDVNGAETKRTLPGGAAVTTAVDSSGRASRITSTDSTAAVRADVGYSYTVAGGSGPTADRSSIQSRTSHLEQGVTPGAVTGYGYDSLRRLTAATETVAATPSASWAYTYDAAGNRTAQTRTGATGAAAGTISYTYDTANRLTAATGDTTTWTYDGAGNQTRNGITGSASTYNVRGAATANGAATYATHGQGNTDTRSRLVGTTTTRYLTSSLGLSGEEVGSALRAFTRTPDGEALANRLGGGSRYYYATDHQGSVIGMFSATGAWLGGYSYSPYGEERAIAAGTAPNTNSLRYISGYFDSSAGLYKLGARYYDPSAGRFTQHDPSGQEANPYAYAGCNPVNASDTTGLYSAGWCAVSAVFLGVATVTAIAGLFIPGPGWAYSLTVAGYVGSVLGVVSSCYDDPWSY